MISGNINTQYTGLVRNSAHGSQPLAYAHMLTASNAVQMVTPLTKL